jgi:hypothetical protein
MGVGLPKGEGGTVYMHVSKGKNDKIKGEKRKKEK